MGKDTMANATGGATGTTLETLPTAISPNAAENCHTLKCFANSDQSDDSSLSFRTASANSTEDPSLLDTCDETRQVSCEWPACSLPKDHWCGETNPFSLRSKTYLKDKRKQPCCEAMFDLIGMDLLEIDAPVQDVAKTLPGGFADRYLNQQTSTPKPYLFIVHFQLPGDKKLAFIGYFAAKPGVLEADTNSAKLFQAFISGTDAFRQSRFKFIPCVSKGPYLVKSMVGSTPAILGNKLTQTYYKGDGYFEVCVDVGSSTIGGGLLKLVKGYLTTLTFDMCFLLEAQSDEELPEVSLATLRFANLDLRFAQKFVPSSSS